MVVTLLSAAKPSLSNTFLPFVPEAAIRAGEVRQGQDHH